MAGGNHPKSSSHKPSSSSAPTAVAAAAAPSSSHRKSRWGSAATTTTSTPNSNPNNNQTPADQKPGDSKLSKANPSPKTGPTPSPAHPKTSTEPAPRSSAPAQIPPFAFPDPAALGPPPPPAYGFHMLERRTIVLADGSVRSYFALPPDYQDFGLPLSRPVDPAANRFLGPDFGGGPPRLPPPVSPDAFRDNREYWNGPDGSAKRKLHGSVDEKAGRDEKEELIRQRQHFMQYANPNGYPMGSDRRGEFLARTSSPSRRDLVDEMRATKYMRIGGGHDSGGTGLKHLEVDQIKLKKACFHFVKVVYENPSLRKNYLEDGKQGRLQCLVCGSGIGNRAVILA
ncbi:proline-rich receptor-like protein kinase PERK9 [Carica papaya]|uniref:proline-rich receptor-like protein kinase PERK9 n=1 Tax=Carica papaya TaxID=3649 RepID=UPI000B8CE14D|nr:proline-rich receptor-like protein kinase PERK9 [Carica papaya]